MAVKKKYIITRNQDLLNILGYEERQYKNEENILDFIPDKIYKLDKKINDINKKNKIQPNGS